MPRKIKYTSTYLDENTAKLLREQAEKRGMTRVEYIRSLLAQKDEVNRKLEELNELIKRYKNNNESSSNFDEETKLKIDLIYTYCSIFMDERKYGDFRSVLQVRQSEISKKLEKLKAIQNKN